MYPSLNALGSNTPTGGMAINKGFGGQMAAPVNVNAPGGVNAQRGTFNQSPADGVSLAPAQNQIAPGTQPPLGPMAAPNQMDVAAQLQQWLAQNRA